MNGPLRSLAHPPAFTFPIFGMLSTELRIQWKSGLSALYLGIPLIWIIIARLLPPEARPMTALIGTYADPVMMGQIFTGAFLARERDQGLLEAWAVTPLGAGGWLASRSLIIGLQGSIGGCILVLGAGVALKWAVFLPAIFMASTSAALIGLILARPFRDILTYFVAGGLTSAVLSLPILGSLIRPGIGILWMTTGPAGPGWAALSAAIGVSAGHVTAAGPAASAAIALAFQGCWTILLFFAARRVFHRGFFRRPGKGLPASVPPTGAST